MPYKKCYCIILIKVYLKIISQRLRNTHKYNELAADPGNPPFVLWYGM